MAWQELKLWLWRSRRKIGVWGYIVEATVFARALFRRRMPGARFVIFAQGRTGSELLCDLLDSHSQIHCDKEILNQPVLAPCRLIRSSALLATCDTYGFKVKIDQLTQRQKIQDVRAFLTRLHDEGWRIIYLSRRNVLRQVLSNVLRAKSGKAHRYRSKDGAHPRVEKIAVDCAALRRSLEKGQAWLAAEEEALSDLPCLRIVYDDDLYTGEQQQQTVKRIATWLGLEYEPMASDLVRNTPRRLVDLVENYEELAASLAGTEYARFLDEPEPEGN
jgi:LPS sulfotransferase NodH